MGNEHVLLVRARYRKLCSNSPASSPRSRHVLVVVDVFPPANVVAFFELELSSILRRVFLSMSNTGNNESSNGSDQTFHGVVVVKIVSVVYIARDRKTRP